LFMTVASTLSAAAAGAAGRIVASDPRASSRAGRSGRNVLARIGALLSVYTRNTLTITDVKQRVKPLAAASVRGSVRSRLGLRFVRIGAYGADFDGAQARLLPVVVLPAPVQARFPELVGV